jgi:hypothetical protein
MLLQDLRPGQLGKDTYRISVQLRCKNKHLYIYNESQNFSNVRIIFAIDYSLRRRFIAVITRVQAGTSTSRYISIYSVLLCSASEKEKRKTPRENVKGWSQANRETLKKNTKRRASHKK